MSSLFVIYLKQPSLTRVGPSLRFSCSLLLRIICDHGYLLWQGYSRQEVSLDGCTDNRQVGGRLVHFLQADDYLDCCQAAGLELQGLLATTTPDTGDEGREQARLPHGKRDEVQVVAGHGEGHSELEGDDATSTGSRHNIIGRSLGAHSPEEDKI